jgi:hypothetical protein
MFSSHEREGQLRWNPQTLFQLAIVLFCTAPHSHKRATSYHWCNTALRQAHHKKVFPLWTSVQSLSTKAKPSDLTTLFPSSWRPCSDACHERLGAPSQLLSLYSPYPGECTPPCRQKHTLTRTTTPRLSDVMPRCDGQENVSICSLIS